MHLTGYIQTTNSRFARFATRFLALALAIFLPVISTLAQSAATSPTPAIEAAKSSSNQGTANPVVLIIVMGALALAPFALIMLTSFVKISVVLSILRNALGTQQVPPNQVITGLALILTIFIMAPVVEKMYAEAGEVTNTDAIFSEKSVEEVFQLAQKGKAPLKAFLKEHTHNDNRDLFLSWARKIAQKNGNDPKAIEADEFRIIIPAFVTTELTEAFIIGFMIFVPFLVIDLVVANILQAMGMFMLSPTIISLPFKLLLFVLINGWVLLIQGLVSGYL